MVLPFKLIFALTPSYHQILVVVQCFLVPTLQHASEQDKLPLGIQSFSFGTGRPNFVWA